jgi:SAM-dependent methyltransferase
MLKKPDFHALKEYYSKDYKSARSRIVNDAYLNIMKKRAISQLKFIRSNLMNYKLQYATDIGCGYGLLLEELKMAQMDASGVEFDPDCVTYCTERGLKVALVSEESNIIPDEMSDLVIASHVLEHLREPDTFLAEIKRKNRIVFIEIPKYDVAINEQFVDQEGHLNFFTQKSLTNLFERCKYNILCVESYGPSMIFFWKDKWKYIRAFRRFIKRDYFFHEYERKNRNGIWVRLLATTNW